MRTSRLTLPRLLTALLLLSGCLLASMALALAVGSAWIPLGTVLQSLFGKDAPSEFSVILLQVRLPRILLAALTGAALACAGAAFQAVLRNPLADPYILGISGGAALGAILSTLAGTEHPFSGWLARPLAAFAGACLTVLLILALSRSRERGRLSSNSRCFSAPCEGKLKCRTTASLLPDFLDRRIDH